MSSPIASDLDLCVFNAADLVVASSRGGTSAETMNLRDPTAGRNYRIVVAPFETDGPSATFTLFEWVLGSTAAGNMTVSAPATAVTGATGAINLNFHRPHGRHEVPGVGRLFRVSRSAQPDDRARRHTVRVPRLDSVETQAPRGEIPGAFSLGRIE